MIHVYLAGNNFLNFLYIRKKAFRTIFVTLLARNNAPLRK